MTFPQSELAEMLKNPASYATQPKLIKLRETDSSYLFECDEWLYKIKKEGNEFPTLAVKEAYCHEECRLSNSFNPNWNTTVLTILENNGGIKMGGTEGEPVEYALKMNKLPENLLLSDLLGNDAVTKKYMKNIAGRISEIHFSNPARDKAAESGKAESVRALCDDMLFQMKRYFDASMTQPILDMIRHPLEKFIDQNKRLFSKRHQKNRIVHGHGAFVPEHIFVNEKNVHFISPQEVHRKLADLDVANDISSLTVELTRLGKDDLAETFLNHYLEISNDLDLQKMLPLYQTYCALKQGVRTCELKVAREDDKLGTLAMEYFNLAVNFSREIPRV
ncbi:MAG: hypothetical protein CL935_01355 [Deltaproteobacteria bacterium]|nr:hypothetical protein [Deltaproteobacteria bacterium]|tara:strand:+ start:49 stop:1050 length:1002 start_codon:yes stop_codon:yes gene_type:complete